MFDYKEPLIKRAIHAIKYYRRTDLITPLATSMVHELKKLPNFQTYTLIPVPMPRVRKLIRGYNQAEKIAQEVAQQTGNPIRTDILLRARTPKRQVQTSTREERLKNQRGAFIIKEDPSHLHVILIDDVTTTGATLEEARNLLLKAGAHSVIAATIAH